MAQPGPPQFPLLFDTALKYPAIDNHAHPLLTEKFRDAVPFEAVISEAEGDALTKDSVHTLACKRASIELAQFFGLPTGVTAPYANTSNLWEAVKAKRQATEYNVLCQTLMDGCNIQFLMIDDGLGGVSEMAESWQWHERFCPTKRIVRVEIEAERTIQELLTSDVNTDDGLEKFPSRLKEVLEAHAANDDVVAFKSIACYRTGLDISPTPYPKEEITAALVSVARSFRENGEVRLADKPLNDFVVITALEIADKYDKPIQFHTGLGDNDLTLRLASPSHMQELFKAYPQTKFVLLHSSYPYTQEAGYLSAVYGNVYLDFGEVFPFVSGQGQRAIIRQVLELCPTNKTLWSTDGHWFPESFYLGTIQARKALYDVLAEVVQTGEIGENDAIEIVQNALFHNSNRLYRLNLTPKKYN